MDYTKNVGGNKKHFPNLKTLLKHNQIPFMSSQGLFNSKLSFLNI